METLTVKNFTLSDIVKKLAFNVPVVEKTAPCDECYRETPIADMVSDLCPECVQKRFEQTDTAPCHNCGRWFHWDQIDGDNHCPGCANGLHNDIWHHRLEDY
jgi:Zn finger protein HypA/HybF involved in hydrogenase expression